MIKLTEGQKRLLHSSREIKFRYDLLNYDEDKIGELEVSNGNVDMNSLAEIKRVAKFTLRENEFKEINWLNEKIQPFFMLKSGSEWIEWSLGIFLISSPSRKVKKSVYRDVEAYDKGLVLLENRLDQRLLIRKSSNYLQEITRILNQMGIWQTKFPEFHGITNIDKEFEIGTSKLEVINTLLKEINFTSIWVDEYGFYTTNPYVLPNHRETEYEYKNDEMSIIFEDTAVEEIDLFGVPNKFIVVASNPEKDPITSNYINENPLSLTSTVNRKRIITDFREENDILDQKTLDEYTKRIAYEASQVFGKFSFETAIMPHHSYMDALYCQHSGLNIAEKYIETSWGMELKAGGRMRHNARRVIEI